jgi:glutamyl-tRNA reductase
METVLDGRSDGPLFIIDISVPRSLDPGIGTLANARLYNIDDLHAISEDNTQKRKVELQKSIAIIEQSTAEFLQNGLFRDGQSAIDFLRVDGFKVRGPSTQPAKESGTAAVHQRTQHA